ncbi:MAG: SMP-30/gluconolactonase/LRE family protein [Rhodothalassiaceae bacterium]
MRGRRRLGLLATVTGLIALMLAVTLIFWPPGAAFLHPMLAACRHSAVVAEGRPLTGIEALAQAGNSLFLAAYDRRHPNPPAGGLYRLTLPLAPGAALQADSLVRGVRAHGLAVHGAGADIHLFSLDRHGSDRQAPVDLVQWRLADGQISLVQRLRDRRLCSANGLAAPSAQTVFVSLDRRACGGPDRLWENARRAASGAVLVAQHGRLERLADALVFANGLAIDPERGLMWVAETRAGRVSRLAIEQHPDGRWNARPLSPVPVPHAPDNLAIAPSGVISAGHPRLLRYALFRAGLIGTAPSQIVRIRPDGDAQRLYQGAGHLSGATAAVLTDQQLIAGAGYDSGLLVCERREAA